MARFQGTKFIPDGSSVDDLDVLHRQTEGETDHLKDLELHLNPKVPEGNIGEFDADLKKGDGLTDFSSVPKPTEILSPTPVAPIEKTDDTNIEVSEKEFEFPLAALDYLSSLKAPIGGPRPISAAILFLRTEKKLSTALAYLDTMRQSGFISDEEFENVRKILGGGTVEEPKPDTNEAGSMVIKETSKDPLTLSQDAYMAFDGGDRSKSLQIIDSMDESDTKNGTLKDIVAYAVQRKDLDFAREVIERAKDEELRASLLALVNNEAQPEEENVKPEVENSEDSLENSNPEVQKLIDAIKKSPNHFANLVLEYSNNNKGAEFWLLLDQVKEDSLHDEMLVTLMIDDVVDSSSPTAKKKILSKIRIPAIKEKLSQLVTAFENNAIKKGDLLKELRSIDFIGMSENPNDAKADDYIDNDEFDKFELTGEVSEALLEQIADRIIADENIVGRENKIYNAKSEEINAIIARKMAQTESVSDPKPIVDTSPGVTPNVDVVSEPQPVAPLVIEDTSVIPDAIVPVTENMEAINAELESARSTYAEQMVLWKNGVRAKKRFWQKVKSEIGFEKPVPEHEKPQELLDAEKAYIEAKKKKREQMLADKVALIADVEAEMSVLQRRILENTPPLEKNIAEKAFEKWSKMGRIQRIALSSTLLAVGSLAFGGGSIAALGTLTAGSLGKKALRAAAGITVGQTTGKVLQKTFSKINENKKEANLDSYATGIDMANFEEKEKQLMEAFEKADTTEKKQRLARALAMAVTGVSAGVAMGAYLGDSVPDVSGQTSEVDTSDSGVVVKSAPTSGSNPVEGMTDAQKAKFLSDNNISSDFKLPKELSGGLDVEIPTSPTEVVPMGSSSGGGSLVEGGPDTPESAEAPTETPKATESVDVEKDMRVEASSKGFIQDVHSIKAEILKHYGGDIEKVPEALREKFMDRPSIKVAEDFGFFDSKTGMSGKTLVGDSLFIDENGNIAFEHKGVKQVLLNAETGEVSKFNGEMFKPKSINVTATASSAEVITEPYQGHSVEAADILRANFESGVRGVFEIETPKAGEYVSITDVPGQEEIVTSNTVESIVGDPVVINGETVGKIEDFNGHRIPVLDDKYQDGSQFKQVRMNFNQTFAERFAPSINVISDTSFEDGKISLVRDPAIGKTQLLLNGKKIADGYINTGVSSLKIDPSLDGGFWKIEDNVYERAFKAAKGMIKNAIESTAPKK